MWRSRLTVEEFFNKKRNLGAKGDRGFYLKAIALCLAGVGRAILVESYAKAVAISGWQNAIAPCGG
ncbi:hypothetical protein AVDCRST_MAG94-4775 [uncultured Leptolyngbya sp.]|uniref:Uncharacterized protein n=1 Tax=uncultured Leptolyngbya sp. TaxID=332963 RepID=A0A6J4N6M4_9CYAN|nr:hypothetical protein AVDCRST_MAG94-4775 [uncultured Leptolyngbya sp.]